MSTKAKQRYEKCKKCGSEWNVSINAKIPKKGYVCPNCRKQRVKKIVTVVKYILLTAAGIIAFKHGADYAFKERGYFAYGGEYLLLLMPFIYYLFADIVKGIKEMIIFFIRKGDYEWKI